MRLTIGLLALAGGLTPRAMGQAAFVLQGGQARNEFGARPVSNNGLLGIGGGAILAGKAGKNAGLALSLYGDALFPLTGKDQTTDVGGGADLLVRLKFISLGPNIDLRWLLRNTPTTDPYNPASIVAFGAGGSARVTFGPQGRAFLQGRYTDYGRLGDATLQGTLLGIANDSIQGKNIPNQRGRRWSATAGYLFPNRFVLRAQVIGYTISFEPRPGNAFGQQDHRSVAALIGIGYTF